MSSADAQQQPRGVSEVVHRMEGLEGCLEAARERLLTLTVENTNLKATCKHQAAYIGMLEAGAAKALKAFSNVESWLLSELLLYKRQEFGDAEAERIVSGVRTLVRRELISSTEHMRRIQELQRALEKLTEERNRLQQGLSASSKTHKREKEHMLASHLSEVGELRKRVASLNEVIQRTETAEILSSMRCFRSELFHLREGLFAIRQHLHEVNSYYAREQPLHLVSHGIAILAETVETLRGERSQCRRALNELRQVLAAQWRPVTPLAHLAVNLGRGNDTSKIVDGSATLVAALAESSAAARKYKALAAEYEADAAARQRSEKRRAAVGTQADLCSADPVVNDTLSHSEPLRHQRAGDERQNGSHGVSGALPPSRPSSSTGGTRCVSRASVPATSSPCRRAPASRPSSASSHCPVGGTTGALTPEQLGPVQRRTSYPWSGRSADAEALDTSLTETSLPAGNTAAPVSRTSPRLSFPSARPVFDTNGAVPPILDPSYLQHVLRALVECRSVAVQVSSDISSVTIAPDVDATATATGEPTRLDSVPPPQSTAVTTRELRHRETVQSDVDFEAKCPAAHSTSLRGNTASARYEQPGLAVPREPADRTVALRYAFGLWQFKWNQRRRRAMAQFLRERVGVELRETVSSHCRPHSARTPRTHSRHAGAAVLRKPQFRPTPPPASARPIVELQAAAEMLDDVRELRRTVVEPATREMRGGAAGAAHLTTVRPHSARPVGRR